MTATNVEFLGTPNGSAANQELDGAMAAAAGSGHGEVTGEMMSAAGRVLVPEPRAHRSGHNLPFRQGWCSFVHRRHGRRVAINSCSERQPMTTAQLPESHGDGCWSPRLISESKRHRWGYRPCSVTNVLFIHNATGFSLNL